MFWKAISKMVTCSLALALLFTIPAQAQLSYDVPTNSSFKSYMGYKAITNKSSMAYKLQKCSVTTQEGLRTYNGYYTVAVGSGFNVTVGDYIDVLLSTGNVLHCIVGDMKQDIHTDSSNMQASNGNVIEFIVDTSVLNVDAKQQGDISVISGFEGYVVSVTTFDNQDTVQLNWEDYQTETVTSDATFEYLIVDKCSTPMPNGETLYTIEYAFGNDFNSVMCTETYYNSVEVGSTVMSLTDI